MANTNAGTKSKSSTPTPPAVIEAGASMSKLPEPLDHNMVVDVDPDIIGVDPEVRALREWTGDTEQEVTLPELAISIWENGQTHPCIVRESPDGLVMVDGERRKAAVELIRSQGESEWGKGAEQLQLRVIVETMTADEAIQAALHSFTHKADLSAMEKSRMVTWLRKRFDWGGGQGTQQIAQFLGVSPATVTEMEKLQTLPKSVQDKIGKGAGKELTTTAATELVSVTGDVPAEKRAEVQERVVKKAKEKAVAESGKKRAAAAKLSPGLADLKKKHNERVAKEKAEKDGKKAAGEKEHALDGAVQEAIIETNAIHEGELENGAIEDVVVTGRHIRAAAKEELGDEAKVRAPKIGELVDLIGPWEGPGLPVVMSKFVSTLVAWCKGQANDGALKQAWDDVGDVVSIGEAVQVQNEEIVPETESTTSDTSVESTPPTPPSTSKPKPSAVKKSEPALKPKPSPTPAKKAPAKPKPAPAKTKTPAKSKPSSPPPAAKKKK